VGECSSRHHEKAFTNGRFFDDGTGDFDDGVSSSSTLPGAVCEKEVEPHIGAYMVERALGRLVRGGSEPERFEKVQY
jgi:hypothetical protein